MKNNKLILKERDWNASSPPPKRFFQILVLDEERNAREFSKCKTRYLESLRLFEIMVRFGRAMVFFRVTLSENILSYLYYVQRFFGVENNI